MTFDVHNWNFNEYCERQRRTFFDLKTTLSRIGMSPSGSLLEFLEQKLIDGLRWLDQLERDDDFWTGRNNLPTVDKLRDICKGGVRSDVGVPRSVWWDAAVEVVAMGGPLAERPLWRSPEVDTIPIRWLLEASWIDLTLSWPPETPMRRVAQRIGRFDDFREILDPFLRSTDEVVRRWATVESGCGARAAG